MTPTNTTTFDRRIADWLAGDPNEAPETVLSSVLDALPTIRQRRVVGGRWSTRPGDRQRFAAALGGIAVIIVIVLAVAMIERGDESVGPSATTTASPAATSEPSPAATAEVTATRAFHSPVNRYAARYPADWSLDAATEAWAPTLDDVIQPAAMDVFAPVPNARGFLAASTPLPAGLAIDDWIDRTLAPRQRPTLRACDNPSAGGVSMGLPPETWQPIRLGGHEARERDSCYTIDVVVQVGRRVYLFSGASPRPAMTPSEDRATFDAFLGSLTFDDDVAPTPAPTPSVSPAPTPVELTESWSSPRYGYDAKIPRSWTVAPATATAKLDRSMPYPERFAPETMDIYSEGLVKRLWVVSMPIAATADLDAWVAVHFPRRQQGTSLRKCRGAVGLPVAESWVPRVIGERAARERDSCMFVDVVVVAGGRAYVISAPSPEVFATPMDERVELDAFVASMVFRPETATAEPSVAPYVPRTTYTSTLYGYTIDVPWTLDVIPGKTAWKPGENWSARGVADRFDRRGGFTIVSTTLPRGASLNDWIAVNLPPPTQAGNACRFGFAIVGVPTGPWHEADLGGHTGLVRDGCEVDGVVAIGRRVYVISSRSLEPGRRMRNLEEIAGYIDFRPNDATAP